MTIISALHLKTGLKKNHIKMILLGKRKCKIGDHTLIRIALFELKNELK